MTCCQQEANCDWLNQHIEGTCPGMSVARLHYLPTSFNIFMLCIHVHVHVHHTIFNVCARSLFKLLKPICRAGIIALKYRSNYMQVVRTRTLRLSLLLLGFTFSQNMTVIPSVVLDKDTCVVVVCCFMDDVISVAKCIDNCLNISRDRFRL